MARHPSEWSPAEKEAWLADGLAPEDRSADAPDPYAAIVRRVLRETNDASATQRALGFRDNAGKLRFSGEPIRFVERIGP